MSNSSAVETQRWRRFAFTSLIYFGCLLVAGLVGYIVLIELLCRMSPSNRCFSITRDAFPILRMWFIPSMVLGVLIGLVAYFCHRLVWWHAPVLVLGAAIVVGAVVMRPIDRVMVGDVLLISAFFFVAWSVITIGTLAAWRLARSMYRVDPGARNLQEPAK